MIMIAMKMEHQIKSQRDGVVERVFFSEGDSAERNQVLIKLNDDQIYLVGGSTLYINTAF